MKWTPEHRRAWARARYRERVRHDENFRQKLLKRNREWKARKIAECPEYRRLCVLRVNRIRLNESIEFHQKAIAKAERRLITLAREIRSLEAKCRKVVSR